MPYKGTPEEIAEKRKKYYLANKEKLNQKNKEWRKENIERDREAKKLYAQKNKEKIAECQAKWRKENKETVLEYRKEYYAANKAEVIAKAADWKSKNPEKAKEILRKYKTTEKGKLSKNAARNERRSRTKQASLGRYSAKEIRELYKTCAQLNKNSNIKFEVDHIVPIMHPNVCGLHVIQNLQIIPSDVNRKKTNKFDGTYDNEENLL